MQTQNSKSIQKALKTGRQNIQDNVVEYFANIIDITGFLDACIRPITPVTDDQVNEIIEILGQYSRAWDNSECNGEGANRKQTKTMDKIENDCFNAIIKVLSA